MNIQNYKHIIWDWNGTLFDDIELCIDIMNKMLIKYNMKQMTTERYKNIFTVPVIDYYEQLGFNINDGTFSLVGKEFMYNYEERRDEADLYYNAKQVLETIKNMGIQQSILSGYFQDTLDEIIPHYGLDNYFDRLIGLGNVYGGSKIDNGKNLVKEINLKNGEAILIGDTTHDYEVADEIGVECILISHGHQSIERLKKCNKPIINNLEELIRN